MKKLIILIFVALLLSGCYSTKLRQLPVIDNPVVRNLVLPAPYDNRMAEYSGLCRLDDYILLLPQYPERFKDEQTEGHFVIVPMESIDIEGSLECIPIEVIGLEALHQYEGYEGFESVTKNGAELYFAIEVGGVVPYTLAIKGKYSIELKQIVLDSNSITRLETPVSIDNASYESVVYNDGKLYFFYEGNGININPTPYVLVTDTDFKVIEQVTLSPIEYRITDVTNLDADVLYAINYHWTGDAEKYNPGLDLLTNTLNRENGIERIIPLQFNGKEFIPYMNGSIINLEYKGRNWEGITKYKDGFLLITDKYPGSEFVYIEAK